MDNDVKRILIICLAGVGDVLMSTPLLRDLRQRYKAAHIDVLVMQGEAARGVLEDNPHIGNRILFDFRKKTVFQSYRFCMGLRRDRYDISFTVMPQNRFEYNLITYLIGARKRVGFRFSISCGALPKLFLTDLVPEDPNAHLIDNNMRLLTEGLSCEPSEDPPRLELHVPPSSEKRASDFLGDNDLSEKVLIGIHAGTGSTKNLSVRRWSLDRWASLAQLIGQDENVRILLFGSEEESELKASIVKNAGLPSDRILSCPPGTVMDAAAFIGKLNCLICCDTLLTHLAAAMGVSEIVIMGPTPHTSVYPYGVRHRIVRTGIECSPCYGYSRHGIKCTHAISMKCLKDITPTMVKHALDELLSGAESASHPK